MPQVLILTGPPGIGKSTIASMWAQHHKGCVVECDYFTEWIKDDHPVDTDYFLSTEPMVARLSANTAKEYAKSGYSVALEGVWTPAGLATLKEQLDQFHPIDQVLWIRLVCELSLNRQRDLSRGPDKHMNERVEVVSRELDQHDWLSYIHTLDTTGLNPQETLEQILAIS